MNTATTNTGLKTKALTVNLSISQWVARKHDKKISKEVEDQHNAHDAGRYNKVLVAKAELEKIQKTAGAARSFHYENTLPWGDNGDRLLPSANYMSYVKEMAILKSNFEREVIAFLANYSTVIDDAKIRLNGMFDPKDYPNEVEIKSKFSFGTCFMPLPDIDDIRVELSQTEVNNIRQEVENTMRDRITGAVKDTWSRIKAQLEAMKERLSTKDAVFRNSLFDNLRDIIELLPRLNVTNDSQIDEICEEMKGLLVDPDAVRANSNLRNEKAQEVAAILNKFDAFFS